MGFSQLNSFTLVALPLFMIAGSLAKAGRLADKLFDVAAAFVGHLPGGLGVWPSSIFPTRNDSGRNRSPSR